MAIEFKTGIEEPDGIVDEGRTAWRIADGDYDAATTLYTFPGGTMRRGDEIGDWSRLPAGTRVHLHVPDQPGD